MHWAMLRQRPLPPICNVIHLPQSNRSCLPESNGLLPQLLLLSTYYNSGVSGNSVQRTYTHENADYYVLWLSVD